ASDAGYRVVGEGFIAGRTFSRNVILRNNKCDQWGQWGMLTGFCDDMVIENNICSHSAQQHGIYFSNSGDRPNIRGNTVFANHASGIQLNADINTGNKNISGVDGITTDA